MSEAQPGVNTKAGHMHIRGQICYRH